MNSHFSTAILLGIWALSVFLTWGIVESPMYDLAGCLHTAERWAGGAVLYKDIQWVYPPLSIYLYGGIMRLFPSCYGALTATSAFLALLSLLGNYRIARLLLGRKLSLVAAITAYLCIYSDTSVSGANFVGLEFIALGIAAFTWFVWAAGTSVRHPLSAGQSLAVGALGGLCMFHKHEQIAGVLAVTVFLAARPWVFASKQRGVRLLPYLAGIVLVAGIGYAAAIHQSGWSAFHAAFTAYGTAAEHAMRNLPSVVSVWLQALLLALHAAFLLLSVAFGLRRAGGTGRSTARRFFLAAVLLGTAAVVGLLAESLRVHLLSARTDWKSVKGITSSLANYGMFERGASPLLATVQYIGGVTCRSVLPVMMFGLILGVFFLRHQSVRHSFPRATPPLQVVALLFCALAGLQVRGLFMYSAYGTFELIIPLALFLAPHLFRGAWSRRCPVSLVRCWRTGHSILLAAYGLVIAGGLYMYEFRGARFNPVLLDTDKGTIRLPRSSDLQAFADVVRFVRTNDLENVVVVPYDGLQFWTGRSANLLWPGFLHPATYHPPWSAQLGTALARGNLTFVQFNHLDTTTVTFPSATVDWIDGPHYTPYRWKEHFPAVWQAIQNDSRLLATFGPTEAPFFSVYQQFRPTTVQQHGSHL